MAKGRAAELARPGISRAIATGLGVCAAGFGAMNLFWWSGDWPTNVRGLWDYRSATIGDGILLPLAAAILVAAGDRLPNTSREGSVVAAVAAMAGLAGAVFQVIAILDDESELNWTLPAAHTLNAPGWYHAGLLVGMSALIAGLAARVLVRARAARMGPFPRIADSLRHPATSILVFCVAGFVGLLVLDIHPVATTATGVAAGATAILGACIALAVLVWSYGRGSFAAWPFLMAGFVFACVLCWMTV